MGIDSLNKNTGKAKVPRGIIPHKEMSPAAKKAGTAPPARPAPSREVTNPAKVILEITENHDLLNEFTSSYEPDGGEDCQAVLPSASPVLKVTGRPESGQYSTVCSEKHMRACSSTHSGGSTSDGQSLLKVADGRSTRGEKPRSPIITCRVNRIRALSPHVERVS